MTSPHIGPWNWHAQGDADEYCLLTDEKRWVIAFRVNGEIMTPEQIKIVQLIAAAPDLIAAARRVAAWIDREKVPYLIDNDDNPGEALRCAIAKAEVQS